MKNKGDKYWDFGLKLVEGCTPVSAGCANCWALGMENRFRKETGIVVHPERLDRPLKRKKPAVYSIWNDLFHEDVPLDFIDRAIRVFNKCPQHTFLILTKRDERLAALDWRCERYRASNIWYGVTVESQTNIHRIKPLPVTTRFVSFEPLLGEIPLNELDKIVTGWVIIGAETGPKRRPCKIEWVRNIVEQCQQADVPVFIKKLEIDGQVTADMSLWPEDLRLRELPWK